MRLVWFIVKLVLAAALLALLAVWLADQPGRVTLDWRGWHVDSSAAFLICAVLLLCLILWKVGKLFFWLRYSGERRVERRLRQRQQDGLRLLTSSLNALASQDLRRAARAEAAARKKLGPLPLITWVAAQIASAKADHKAAGSAFLALTREPHAANLGWRGLMAARQHTAHAAQLQPVIAGALADKRIARQAYVHEARFAAAARVHDWEELRRALDFAEEKRALPRSRLRQVEQVLGLARGQALQVIETTAAGKTAQKAYPSESQARLLLERAYKIAPDFAPAALAYIDALLNAGDRITAGKVIAANWLLNPGAALLERFEAAYENETALARLQRFERFAQKRPDELETQLALAQLSLAAELYGKAKTHAEQAQAQRASVRGYQVLADLALAAEDNAALAHRYARRGAAAPDAAGTGYRCQVCGTRHAQFHFLCESCGAFATLVPATDQATDQARS